MLLIYTTSYDATVDLLMHHMDRDGIFRLNFDLWRQYKLDLWDGGFSVEDPLGRRIDSESLTKFLWRKPLPTKDLLLRDVHITEEDEYYEAELWYAIRDLVNLMWMEDKVVLVEPSADSRAGKFVQARLAQEHFESGRFQFRLGAPSRFGAASPVVVKSLTSKAVELSEDKKVIYATQVMDSELSPGCPWMVQELIEAEKDVTVLLVRDTVFAFELDRRPFKDRSIDWRELAQEETADQWTLHSLPDCMTRRILSFMHSLQLHFGRLDFLIREGEYYFLEVNPNGQWAWLDAERRHGLLDKIIEEIDPGTPCHPIPRKWSSNWQ